MQLLRQQAVATVLAMHNGAVGPAVQHEQRRSLTVRLENRLRLLLRFRQPQQPCVLVWRVQLPSLCQNREIAVRLLGHHGNRLRVNVPELS